MDSEKIVYYNFERFVIISKNDDFYKIQKNSIFLTLTSDYFYFNDEIIEKLSIQYTNLTTSIFLNPNINSQILEVLIEEWKKDCQQYTSSKKYSDNLFDINGISKRLTIIKEKVEAKFELVNNITINNKKLFSKINLNEQSV